MYESRLVSCLKSNSRLNILNYESENYLVITRKDLVITRNYKKRFRDYEKRSSNLSYIYYIKADVHDLISVCLFVYMEFIVPLESFSLTYGDV